MNRLKSRFFSAVARKKTSREPKNWKKDVWPIYYTFWIKSLIDRESTVKIH